MKNNKSTDKVEAFSAAISATAKGILKQVPFVSILIDGLDAYLLKIKEQQRIQFINSLSEKMENLKKNFNADWYSTKDGLEVSKKILSSALNEEFSEKVEYFVNALINARLEFDQLQRLKFIEILRNISKPALLVLSIENEINHKRGARYSQQVLHHEIIANSEIQPHLVESCVNELYSLGVFSSTVNFTSDGKQNMHFEDGVAAFTDFTRDFIKFIKDPRID